MNATANMALIRPTKSTHPKHNIKSPALPANIHKASRALFSSRALLDGFVICLKRSNFKALASLLRDYAWFR